MNCGSVYTRAELFNCLLKCDLSNLGTTERLTEFSHFNVDTWRIALGGAVGDQVHDTGEQQLLNTLIWTFISSEAKHIFCGARGAKS
jgi:hypothetical protein